MPTPVCAIFAANTNICDDRGQDRDRFHWEFLCARPRVAHHAPCALIPWVDRIILSSAVKDDEADAKHWAHKETIDDGENTL